MESLSSLRKQPDKDLIQDIGLRMGIDPALVEKDRHATQLLAALSSYQNDKGIRLIFSGGTSLSKGYDLIQRFSEDLDFVLVAPEANPPSVGQRRHFRQEVLSIVAEAGFEIDPDGIQRGDSHRFFKAPIQYHRVFENTVLRPYLQLEMTFSGLNRVPEDRPIQSIVSKVMKEDPETVFTCVSPIETAGDKLSALTWRVLVRDRKSPKDDPTLIRHLHDLASLAPIIMEQKRDFMKSAITSLEQDRTRRGGEAIEALTSQDRLTEALRVLRQDDLYRKEYEQFVDNMSYADEGQRMSFDASLLSLDGIINLVSHSEYL
ncbi:MAG: nucleotidyl transferase AbiEii/AbiGii toxin family protein [Alphaproteobacteria bacterium]|nr:nucleotidyl transferase AbiEii/AbiGii toxin family protein [Alphaproteobacteria bacterium]